MKYRVRENHPGEKTSIHATASIKDHTAVNKKTRRAETAASVRWLEQNDQINKYEFPIPNILY
jgi:hypothetical protein